MTLQPATAGDTNTLHETLTQCGEHIREVAADTNNKAEQLNPEGPAELVLDKGYHSNDVVIVLKEVGVRSYCSEPDRGRRNWIGKEEEKSAYIRTAGGSEASAESVCCASVASESNEASPTCTKPEPCEEPTCGGTTTSSNGCSIHAGAFNLGLVIRKISGCGTPRGFQGDLNAFLIFIPLLWKVSANAIPRQWPLSEPHEVTSLKNATPFRMPVLCRIPALRF